MSETNATPEGATDGAGQNEPSTEPSTEAQPSNADVKNSELFQKVTSELAEYKRKEAERAKADEEAKANAERQRLESEGKYKEALELKEKQLAEALEKHQRELTQRDLKTELFKAGFNNDVFINGAVTGYTDDAGSVADYVKALTENEANKVFLGAQGRTTLPEPTKPAASGSNMSITDAQRVAKDSAATPEQRSQARMVMAKHIEKHGRLPG